MVGSARLISGGFLVVIVLVVSGGFSLWVWIFCAEIDFKWVSQLGLS